jgi:hypothetical protein
LQPASSCRVFCASRPEERGDLIAFRRSASASRITVEAFDVHNIVTP